MVNNREDRFGTDPYHGQESWFWQGTILRRELPTPDRRIIASADCDMLEDKGKGEFFCLKIIPAREYLTQAIFGDLKAELIEVLCQASKEIAVQRNEGFARVGLSVIEDWVREGSIARWKADLSSVHHSELDLLGAIQDCLRRLSAGESAWSDGAWPRAILKCENEQMAARVKAVNRSLAKKIQSHLEPSRADIYVLPSLEGDDDKGGYFVPFKTLSLMSRSDILIKGIDMHDRPDGFRPIATCRPVLLHSLLQKMVMYFSRIGLAKAFDAEQKVLVKNIVELVQQ